MCVFESSHYVTSDMFLPTMSDMFLLSMHTVPLALEERAAVRTVSRTLGAAAPGAAATLVGTGRCSASYMPGAGRCSGSQGLVLDGTRRWSADQMLFRSPRFKHFGIYMTKND